METLSIFPTIAIRIIQEQELVIGPLAWGEAKKVSGLHILDQNKGNVVLDGDPKEILNQLVAQYARLFGKTSNELCKEAVHDLIATLSPDEVPSSLK